MPPIVDVTLLSLTGVSLSLEITNATAERRIPKLTAAVAFSGSAADMQVGSSFVCPRTGNLMVESDSATTILPHHGQQQQQQQQLLQYQPLIAQWNDGGNSSYFSNGCSLDPQQHQHQDERPHVSIQLPPQDPRLPAMSISRCNRDSKIILATSTSSYDQQQPSLHESEVSSQESSLEQQQEEEDGQAGSVFWSQSGAGGAVMPEIVELSVSLKVDTESLKPYSPTKNNSSTKRLLVGGAAVKETPSLLDSTDSWDEDVDHHLSESLYEVGIAYLVLFGNDGGTTVMDLPIKQLKSKFPEAIRVDDCASLRVRVNVYPTGKKPVRRCSRNPALAMGMLQRQAYQLHDTNVLEPILRQLKVADEKKVTSTASQAVTGQGGGDQMHPDLPAPAAAAMLCGMTNVLDFLKSVNCDDGGDGIMPRSADSMDSTINTAPSMTFW
jgi:hypothetical protein